MKNQSGNKLNEENKENISKKTRKVFSLGS